MNSINSSSTTFYQHKLVCLDIETTGLNPGYDEIIQLVIISDSGRVLFSQKFKPIHRKHWPSAERINHISPKDVESCEPIHFLKKEIENILSQSEKVIGYNLLKFDLPMLDRAGIDTQLINNVEDVMILYSKYNKRNYNDEGFKKLSDAGSYFNYYNDAEHDSEGDAFLTLNIYKRLKQSNLKQPSYLNKLRNEYRLERTLNQRNNKPKNKTSIPRKDKIFIVISMIFILYFLIKYI